MMNMKTFVVALGDRAGSWEGAGGSATGGAGLGDIMRTAAHTDWPVHVGRVYRIGGPPR